MTTREIVLIAGNIALLGTLAFSGCSGGGDMEVTPLGSKREDYNSSVLYCKAFSEEDIKKDFRNRFTYCMASKGWRVTYK